VEWRVANELRLMCVLAHPDDESMGTGGILAKYAAEGNETFLVCATRGERGWYGDEAQYPGQDALGRIRETELHAAARVLGIRRTFVLDYVDGELDRADPAEIIPKIVRVMREIRPQVVVSFAGDGAYGHPDHIAISQFTTAACVAAADAGFATGVTADPHRVAKLYYLVTGPELAASYREVIDGIGIDVDGVQRREVVWPDWAITTRIDCSAHWQTVWRAVCCHQSQLAPLGELDQKGDDLHQRVWGRQEYYRAYSLVNGGRMLEDDLFAGLR
jgi:LmbE family N-acetylglucosaminyl deacetylase